VSLGPDMEVSETSIKLVRGDVLVCRVSCRGEECDVRATFATSYRSTAVPFLDWRRQHVHTPKIIGPGYTNTL
jgi:hypothetical protein